MPLLMSLPETLAILAGMIAASILFVAVVSQMVVAIVPPFLADVVNLLVAVVVAMQDPLDLSIRYATNWATMPPLAINDLIRLLSMKLSPHCRLSTPLLAYQQMIAGILIPRLLTISLMT
jgi:type IV secretory pathway TrbD component